jgi:hypothetical protein
MDRLVINTVGPSVKKCNKRFSHSFIQFSKLFKNTICKGVCTVECTEKRFIPFTPPPFSSLMCPPKRI